MDLDHDGERDDSISHMPFSLEVPTVPYPGNERHWDWDRQGTSEDGYLYVIR